MSKLVSFLILNGLCFWFCSSNNDMKRGIHKVINNTIKKYVNANNTNNTNGITPSAPGSG